MLRATYIVLLINKRRQSVWAGGILWIQNFASTFLLDSLQEKHQVVFYVDGLFVCLWTVPFLLFSNLTKLIRDLLKATHCFYYHLRDYYIALFQFNFELLFRMRPTALPSIYV